MSATSAIFLVRRRATELLQSRGGFEGPQAYFDSNQNAEGRAASPTSDGEEELVAESLLTPSDIAPCT